MNRFSYHHFYRILLGLLFGIICVALFQMQVIQGAHYKQIAENNFVRLRRITATRGEIYDRKFRTIAENVPSHNLYLITGRIRNYQALSEFLTTEFNISREELNTMIENRRFRSYEDILISENIPYEKVLALSEHLNYFPELLFRTETTRNYLYPNHFTGYVGRINETEYQLYKEEGYTINCQIGKTGLEKFYEVLIRGKDGREIVQVDAFGRNLNLFRTDNTILPENGLSLVLTIDNDIQKFAESIFPAGVRGAIVVIDVSSGGILAYLSKPSYNPNLFTNRINIEEWQALINDPARPMLDRVIHAAYPPASGFKVVTSGFGLEKGLVGRNTTLANCAGGMQIGNRFFKCWKPAGHGSTNVIDAIKVSCDVYFYDLSMKMRLDEYKQYVTQSMMGIKTGIDLPNERSGFFPDTQWYLKNVGRDVSITGQTVNLSIGQGEALSTPLQMSALYQGIANNGIWITPHLLSQTAGKNVLTAQQINPIRRIKLPFNAQNLRIIQEGLYSVCNVPGGTATGVRVKGARTYGKTGSAENPFGELTHAWFSGYIVTDKPEIVVTVFLENAGSGGAVAAPLATKIFNYYMGNVETVHRQRADTNTERSVID